MDAASNVLRHPKGGCEGVDGTSGVGQNRKLGDLQGLTDSINVIYRSRSVKS